MKKLTYFIIIIMAIATLVAAEGEKVSFEPGKFSVTVSAGIRNITEDLYETVFGKNNLAYSLDLGYRVWRGLEIFLHTDYFSANGETTLTQEETTLTLVPIELGARVMLIKGRFIPYVGAGGGYYMIKDKMMIEGSAMEVEDKGFGFFGEAGFKFYFGRRFFVDIKGKYVALKAKADDPVINAAGGGVIYIQDRNLGGLAFMGGLGISF